MKKTLQVLGILIAVFCLLFLGVNFFVKSKINTALKDLEKENDFSYSAFEVKVFPAFLALDSLVYKQEDNKVFIEKVKLENFSYWKYLTKKQIDIKQISIKNPEIELLKKTKKIKDTSAQKSSFTFEEKIQIGNINIENADFTYKEGKVVKLALHKYNIELENITIDQEKLKEKIPFAYEDYNIKGGKLTYLLNKLQTLTTENIEIKKENAVFKEVKLLPNYTRENYVKVIPHEKDLMSLNLKELKINDYKIHLDAVQDQFLVRNIEMDEVNFQIYRDKTIKDDPNKKKMYSAMLRDLPFGLSVDSLQLNHINLTYEEVQEKTGKTGKVFFTNMNVDIKNLTNIGMEKEDFPKTLVDINCHFMGRAPLHTIWNFKVNDPADHFRIRGTSSNIPPEVINSFADPAFNIHLKGEKIDALNFDFYGDKRTSQGKFHMVYDDLKVEVMKKGNDQEKNKVLSFIANIAMKHQNQSNDEVIEVLDVERDPTRSFWNYFWNNIFSGLKKTLI